MKFLENSNRQLDRLSEDRFYLGLLLLLAAGMAIVIMGLTLQLHRNFLLIACDTAEFQNAIVNTLDGRWFRDTAYDGPNVLGLHSVLALLLVAPACIVFPAPEVLFTLQVWGVYSAVLPLYLIGLKMTLRPMVSFLIALTALGSPLFLIMATGPYHPESWITAAVLWSYYFYRCNHVVGFWIALAVAMTSGEQAASIYLALGAALLLFDDGLDWRMRYGRYALIAGAVWMVFAVGVLAPLTHVPGQQNLIARHYAQWHSNSAGELLGAWSQDSGRVIGMLLNPFRWWHLFSLMGLPLALAFFSRRSLILLLPLPIFS